MTRRLPDISNMKNTTKRSVIPLPLEDGIRKNEWSTNKFKIYVRNCGWSSVTKYYPVRYCKLRRLHLASWSGSIRTVSQQQ